MRCRWRLHGLFGAREFVADVHGVDGAGVRFCSFANEKRRIMREGNRHGSSHSLAESF
jgi:hypothetical protein